MKTISDEQFEKLYEVYLRKYDTAERAQGGAKRDKLDYSDFKTELISERHDIAKEYQSKGGVRKRPSNARIAEDLARQDVYFGSYKQGAFFFDVLAKEGNFDVEVKVNEKTGEVKTKYIDPNTGKEIKKGGFARKFQMGELDEDQYDDAVKAALSAQYDDFKKKYYEKHGKYNGAGTAFREEYRRTYYGE